MLNLFKSILLFICLFLSVESFAQKKLLILGDSLTEGLGVTKNAAYPALLEQKINQNIAITKHSQWTVLNAGVSGSTTASALSRIKWSLKAKPDAVLIMLGANDGLRGFSVQSSEKNLDQAITFLKKEKIRVFLGGIYMPPNYGKDYTKNFSSLYSRLSKKHQIALLPFILDKVAGDPKLNQADGIHPNEDGHKIIAETVYQFLKDKL